MKPREVANPENRFRSVATTYDDGEGPPPASVQILDDKSRSILSRNDSPDLGFTWSANPYRGCQTACAYCLDGETPILMGDSRTMRLADVKVGDEVYGTRFDGKYRSYVRTRVLDHWATRKPAYRIALGDGTELIASGDHRFLSNRGWKFVMPAERPSQRPFLTTANALIGFGKTAQPPRETVGYRRGYLCGLVRGDATLKHYDYSGRRRDRDVLYQFRLALADLEALYRAKRYLVDLRVETQEFQFTEARAGYRPMRAIRTSSQGSFEEIERVIAWPDAPEHDWSTGFLAGIFDAEGSHSRGVLRISNQDPTMIDQTMAAMTRLGFDAIVERVERTPKPIFNVRVRGGLSERLRFFHQTGPAITRKWDLENTALKNPRDLRVLSVEPLGKRDLFDITTGTGDFIANGVVSHNCYARPTHEYLDMGAGTDFDTKIVAKREAPELLREAFEKPSWKGELVMFSGVTDCYQPTERTLELTKQCLQVCLDYRNPVSVISKHALVERDIDLFLALKEQARFHLSVSLAWTDHEMARAIEPWAPSPTRRLQIIETMAKAGVPVGIMIAPVIPGLNDSQLVGLLERAANAGATTAGWTLLRLPGAVAEVFPQRLQQVMPLTVDRVMHRIRETRGGEKLYDSAFGTRRRGTGVYAQTIGHVFDSTMRRLKLTGRYDDFDQDAEVTTFRRPEKPKAQLSLF